VCWVEYIFRGIGRGLPLSKSGRIDNIFTRVQNAGERGAGVDDPGARRSVFVRQFIFVPITARDCCDIRRRRVRLIEFAARKMLVVRSPSVRIKSEQRSGNWFVTF
jgi:hypothetical protein